MCLHSKNSANPDFEKLIRTLTNPFNKSLEATKHAVYTRLLLRCIKPSFIQKNKDKLRKHSAKNCNVESAVCSVKTQLNIQQKSEFVDNSNLMSLRMSKVNDGLRCENKENFMKNTSKSVFNSKSIRSKIKQMKTKRITDSIKTSKKCTRNSRFTEIQGRSKDQRQTQRFNKL